MPKFSFGVLAVQPAKRASQFPQLLASSRWRKTSGFFARLIPLIFATLACGPVVSVQVTAVAIGAGTPLPNISIPLSGLVGTPTPPAPEIFLEYGGARFAPNSAPNVLKLKTDESVAIVVRAPTLPAVLWISELDANGLPLTTAVLTPTAASTSYTPQSTGLFRLKVTADWAYPVSATSVFDVEVLKTDGTD